MTCHRVPTTPSLCTCGVVLDITVFHGEDDIGNDLCPTCSGCGCEPNERNLMTPDELIDAYAAAEEATPPYLVGRLFRAECLRIFVASLPVPKPDHSMCARRDPSLRRAVQEAIGEASVCWDNMSGAGVFDVARANAVADRLCAILDIPEQGPTVVECAAVVIHEVRCDGCNDKPVKYDLDAAQALADAGLLVRDGEQ